MPQRNGVSILKNRMRGSKITLAEVFAAQLESDPAMAAKIKEHIPQKTLLRLLDIDLKDYFDKELMSMPGPSSQMISHQELFNGGSKIGIAAALGIAP